MPEKIYEPGDVIEGVGVVDFNHCGFAWPVCTDGGIFCGIVQVKLNTPYRESPCPHCGKADWKTWDWCDAKSGKLMTHAEATARKNDLSYDYNRRYQDHCGRRYAAPVRLNTRVLMSRVRQFIRSRNWLGFVWMHTCPTHQNYDDGCQGCRKGNWNRN